MRGGWQPTPTQDEAVCVVLLLILAAVTFAAAEPQVGPAWALLYAIGADAMLVVAWGVFCG